MASPFVALLLAAGTGSRMGADLPKAWLELEGRSIVGWSALRLARLPGHRGTVLAVDGASLAERVPALRAVGEALRLLAVVEGGATRQASCARALAAAGPWLEPDLVVAVHDAARPFFPLAEAEATIDRAATEGGAILGHRARDTLKQVDAGGRVVRTIDRAGVFHAATPQCFRADLLARMLREAEIRGLEGTDEAALAEALGIPVVAVEGPATNLKLTLPEDLALAPSLLRLVEAEDQA